MADFGSAFSFAVPLKQPGSGLALSLKAEAIACLLVAASGAILSTHIPKPTQKNTVFTGVCSGSLVLHIHT